MADAILQAEGLSKRFGDAAAVDGVSLTARRGEVVALLGPSGCGKTTTLRMIAGFETPDAGTIAIAGAPMAGRRPFERDIGVVFQDYALFPHMSVADNLAYGLRRRRVPRREIARRTEAGLATVKLTGLEKRMPGQLSGGQQQRVALARSLVTEPALLLLDEPLSNLDARLRQELRVELREILTAAGATTIIVTHDQEEALGLADRIVVMRAGRIMQEGEGDRLYRAPANRFVAEFFGHVNWFSLTAQHAVDRGLQVRADDGFAAVLPHAGNGAGRIAVGIRPESIDIVRPGQESGEDASLSLKGRVELVERLGAQVSVWVRSTAGSRLQALQPNRGTPAFERDEPVTLRFHPADLIAVPQET